MIICDAPSFLFVHVPKCGGMSMVKALNEGSVTHHLCLPNTKHELASAFIGRHGRETFDRFFSFAIVRHPIDRFLSLDRDFAAICERIGLQPRALPWANKSNRSIVQANARAISFVRDYYARDFELLGYATDEVATV